MKKIGNYSQCRPYPKCYSCYSISLFGNELAFIARSGSLVVRLVRVWLLGWSGTVRDSQVPSFF